MVTLEARARALDIIGLREVRKLERAGLRFELTDTRYTRAYPRRRARRRMLAYSVIAIMAMLVAIYAVRFATTTVDFLRS